MKQLLQLYFAVGVAGFIGAITRLFVQSLSIELFGKAFPIGTLVINITGSFIFGWFWQATLNRPAISPMWKLAVLVGFIGSYTTFSTFMGESHRLLEEGAWIRATLNIGGSVILGLLAVQLGIRLAGR